MPEYDFRCKDPKCDVEFSFWMDRHDEAQPDCIECGGSCQRQIGSTNFILNGGGWYGKAYGQSKPLKSRK